MNNHVIFKYLKFFYICYYKEYKNFLSKGLNRSLEKPREIILENS